MDKDTENHIAREIEKLAVMIAEGFARTATRDEVNRRFEELETRMDTRFDRIDARLASHVYRIESLERDVADLKG